MLWVCVALALAQMSSAQHVSDPRTESTLAINGTTTPSDANRRFLGVVSDWEGDFISAELDDISGVYTFVPPPAAAFLDIRVLSTGDDTCYEAVEVGLNDAPDLPPTEKAAEGDPCFLDELKSAALSLTMDSLYCTPTPIVSLGAKPTLPSNMFLVLRATSAGHTDRRAIAGCSVHIYYAFRSRDAMARAITTIIIPLLTVLFVCLAGAAILKKSHFRVLSAGGRQAFDATLRALPCFLTDTLPQRALQLYDWCLIRWRRGGLRLVSIDVPDEDEERHEGEPHHSCRICKDGTSRESLISPCQCSGSCQYVHQSCLDRWRLEPSRNQNIGNKCEICRSTFEIPVRRTAVLHRSASRAVRLTMCTGSVLLIAFMTSALLTAVLGESSCFEQYHAVDYQGIYSVRSLLSGGVWYAMICFFHCQSRMVLRVCGCISCDWALNALAMLLTLLPIALILLMGSAFRLMIYLTLEGTVWTWETSPVCGFVLMTLIGILCFGFAAVRVMCIQCVGDRNADAEDAEDAEDLTTSIEGRSAVSVVEEDSSQELEVVRSESF